jgi:hypothetical protein
VLAPNAKLRPLGEPQGPEVQEQAAEVAVAAACEVETVQAGPHRIAWARLLKRVFDIDRQHCPSCGGGELKIIAAMRSRRAKAATCERSQTCRLDGHARREAQFCVLQESADTAWSLCWVLLGLAGCG